MSALEQWQLAERITKAAEALNAPGAGPYDRPAKTEAGKSVLWRTAPASGVWHGRGSYWSPAREVADALSVMHATRRFLAAGGLYHVTAKIPEHDSVPLGVPWGIWRLETSIGSVYRLPRGVVPDGPAGPLRTSLDARIRTGWPGKQYRWLVFTEPAEDKIPANAQFIYLGTKPLTPVLVDDGSAHVADPSSHVESQDASPAHQ